MELNEISIYNYRSILNAEHIKLSNYTILLGKNNEGKTNFMSALNLALYTISRPKDELNLGSRKFHGFESAYSRNDDYPVQLKESKKNKPTRIRLDFTLSDEDKDKFYKVVGIYNNGSLNIEIVYSCSIYDDNENKAKFIIHGKTGRGGTSYTNHIYEILAFITETFHFTYIPAIRTSDDSIYAIKNIIRKQLRSLKNDDAYTEALNVLLKKEDEIITKISDELTPTLQEFLPNISNVSIKSTSFSYGRPYTRDIDVIVDDGKCTNLDSKGDGVKSLITLALLKNKTYYNDGLIAIEEPESHLHSGAIHQINKILRDISNSQKVIISTHNSVFVNMSDISSNIIVSGGECRSANNVREIRKELGIEMSENLVTTDNMIIVEGESDKRIVKKILLELSPELGEMFNENRLSIYSANSASKVHSVVKVFENWMVKCFSILDNDNAGREAERRLKNDGKQTYILPKFNAGDIEIENLLPDEIIEKVLGQFKLKLKINEVKKNKKIFSVFLQDVFNKNGITLTDEVMSRVKTAIADEVISTERITSIMNYNVIDSFNILVQNLLEYFN